MSIIKENRRLYKKKFQELLPTNSRKSFEYHLYTYAEINNLHILDDVLTNINEHLKEFENYLKQIYNLK